jgi:hypothetical protein
MKINHLKRPWEPRTQTRYSPDKFYQSSEWKTTRKIHMNGATTVSPEEFKRILEINPGLKYTGGNIANTFCLACFKEGRIKAGNNIDHILAIKMGGSRTDGNNLQTLCEYHHASKSANEGKK